MSLTWRMTLASCERALAYRLQLQADFLRFGQVEAARYWQADIDELEARRAELLAWRDGQAARCSMQLSDTQSMAALSPVVRERLAKYSALHGVPMTKGIAGLLDVFATEGNVFRVFERLAAQQRDRKADLARKRLERYRARQKAERVDVR